jgi:muramoyltetrapeptide carboxypeptidase
MQLKGLTIGSKVYITAPAKAIDPACITNAVSFLEQNGFQVQVAAHCLGQFNYFSGSDFERSADLQKALDDENVDAIWCARGGYGAVRIVDELNWKNFLEKPKWLIGFSDITVFHNRINGFNVPSIHATMPLNLKENSKSALQSFLSAIKGDKLSYNLNSSFPQTEGSAQGLLVGGNLSILYSLLGTNDNIDYRDKILFIEDVGEQLYNIDRMLYTFDKAGILDQIKGLIVGGFTDLKDTAIPFGQNHKEIILSKFTKRNIPIAFDFPAGHIDDNRALVFGVNYHFEVHKNYVKLFQL